VRWQNNQNNEQRLLALQYLSVALSTRLSVRPSIRPHEKNSAFTGRIFMKFDI